METKRTASPTLREDMKSAIHHWAVSIQSALNSHYGKDKVGFALVLFHTKGPEMVYNSNGNDEDMVELLRTLADRLSLGDGDKYEIQ